MSSLLNQKRKTKKLRKSLILLCFLLFIFLFLSYNEYISFVLNYLYCGLTYHQYIKPDNVIHSINNRKDAKQVVPKILHQTYKDFNNIPEHWKNSSESCRLLHKDWKIMLWTDESAREFIKTHYSKEDLDNYDSYPYNIQRIDVLRYYILYYYGGVVIDMDIGCRLSLEPLLEYDFVVPLTQPIGFSNDFIVSSPNHPFMEYMINHLKEYNRIYLDNYYVSVMFSTGPMYLTQLFMRYMKEKQHGQMTQMTNIVNIAIVNNVKNYVMYFEDKSISMVKNEEDEIYFLSDELYGGSKDNENNEYRLFNHVEGSSWHDNEMNIHK